MVSGKVHFSDTLRIYRGNSPVGFIRDQEERLTMRFLVWKYQKMNIEVPPIFELQEQTSKIVCDAHRIARERGNNFLSIVKELIENFKKPK
jgi:tRNA/tmRNA/rRNA uracil-C5-methylase (TrmA/RlmC/RlmD family)